MKCPFFCRTYLGVTFVMLCLGCGPREQPLDKKSAEVRHSEKSDEGRKGLGQTNNISGEVRTGIQGVGPKAKWTNGKVPPEKAGRYITAKAGAKITLPDGRTLPLFEGRTYPLKAKCDGGFIVDYYGKDGTIPEASAWRLEEAVRHYVQLDGAEATLFPFAPAAHVAVAVEDLTNATMWYEMALAKDVCDPSALLGLWEASEKFGPRVGLKGLEDACDRFRTYELSFALASFYFWYIEWSDPYVGVNGKLQEMRPDEGPLAILRGPSNKIEQYLRLSSLIIKIKSDFPGFPKTESLEEKLAEYLHRAGGQEKVAQYVEGRKKIRDDLSKLEIEGKKKRADAYARLQPEAKSFVIELRQLTERFRTAKRKLLQAEKDGLLFNGEAPSTGMIVDLKWHREYRDRIWNNQDFSWQPLVPEKLPNLSSTNPQSALHASYPEILSYMLKQLERIDKRVLARKEVGPSHNDVGLVRQIHWLAAAELGYYVFNGELPDGRRAPTGKITFQTVVEDMEATVGKVENLRRERSASAEKGASSLDRSKEEKKR